MKKLMQKVKALKTRLRGGTAKQILLGQNKERLCFFHAFHFGHGEAIAVEFFDEAAQSEVESFLASMRDKYDVWNCTNVGYGPRRVILDTRDDSALDPKFKNVSFNMLFERQYGHTE